MIRYTIYQVAEMLGTSHTTIYNKLENSNIKKDMRNFIIKDGKHRFIDSDGIDVLRKHIVKKESLKKPLQQDSAICDDIYDKTIDNSRIETLLETLEIKNNKLINSLEDRIKELNLQIENKDRQIEQLLQQLNSKDRLFENMQVLLSQPKRGFFQRLLGK